MREMRGGGGVFCAGTSGANITTPRQATVRDRGRMDNMRRRVGLFLFHRGPLAKNFRQRVKRRARLPVKIHDGDTHETRVRVVPHPDHEPAASRKTRHGMPRGNGKRLRLFTHAGLRVAAHEFVRRNSPERVLETVVLYPPRARVEIQTIRVIRWEKRVAIGVFFEERQVRRTLRARLGTKQRVVVRPIRFPLRHRARKLPRTVYIVVQTLAEFFLVRHERRTAGRSRQKTHAGVFFLDDLRQRRHCRMLQVHGHADAGLAAAAVGLQFVAAAPEQLARVMATARDVVARDAAQVADDGRVFRRPTVNA